MKERTASVSVRTRLAFSLALLVVALFCGAGCGPQQNAMTAAATATSRDSGDGADNSGGVRFRNVAGEAGIRYEWKVTGKRPLNILQTIGNGAAFLDYNNDNHLDILCVGQPLALYRGDGSGRFTDVSTETGLADARGHFLGVAVGDVNNDGWNDLYISGYRTGRLFVNQKGQKFADSTDEFGLKPQPWGTSAGFADLDNDGFLELYVANYADFGPKTAPQMCEFQTPNGPVPSSCGPKLYKGVKGALLHNIGGTRFVDVTKAWGAGTHNGRGLGVAFADFDNSGGVSMAVANDEAPGDLFQNLGRRKLENNAVPLNVAYDRDGNVHGGMGVDWGDYNNDSRMDLFVATFRNEIKCLYRNDGDSFLDVAYPIGLGQATMPWVAFGAKFLDADNDGWLDLLIANGHVQDNIEVIEDTIYRQPMQFFRNQGNAGGTFREAPTAFDKDLPKIVGRGLAVGDYDSDGLVDAIVVDSEGKLLLLHNESKIGNSWIGFRIGDASRHGKNNNRNGYGTRITLTLVSGQKRVRDCQTAGSYLSASDPRVHFGLRAGDVVKSAMVRWPNGKIESLPTDLRKPAVYNRLP